MKSVLPALVLGAAVLLAACGTTVAGAPTADPSVSPAPSVPPGLDTGTFPTTAQPVPAATSDASWVVEGNRMGDEALIQVNEVDPRLTMGGAILRSYPVLSGDQLVERVPDATAAIFQKHSMRVGMTTTRGDRAESPTVAVRIGLYRFDGPEAAARAVDDIRDATRAQRPIPIGGTTGVVAGEFKPGTVDTYRSEGPFVINISGTGRSTEDGAALVTKAYGLELARLKTFTPTPVAKVPTLPVDVDGIVSRTLPLTGEEATPVLIVGHYGLAGVLHRIADISRDAEYRAAGIDLVAQRGNVVYRTRDERAAREFAQSLSARHQPIAGIPGLPSVSCGTHPTTRFTWCNVAVGRYMSSVSDKSERVAKQKAAAQYATLATTR